MSSAALGPVDRDRAIRRVLLVTLALNLLVAVAKVVVGRLFGVLTLEADGIHSTLDGLNNVVGLLALAMARRPPDEGHPYGHRKFETFAALGLGVSLVLLGWGLAREALGRLSGGAHPEAHPVTFATALVTLAINLGVARYEARRGRELASEFLLADAHHTSSDALVTIAVIGALVGVALELPAVDLVAALLVVGLIGRVAYRVVVQNVGVLADAAALDPQRIVAVAREVEGVRACHKARSRGPAGHVFVDLHVQVDPSLPTAASHAIGHRVSDALKAALPGVVEVLVHVEPFTARQEDAGSGA